MPLLIGLVVEHLLVARRHDVAVRPHVRKTDQEPARVRGAGPRRLEIAEQTAEGDLLVIRDVLVTEDEHRISLERRADLVDHLLGERPGEFEPNHLGGEQGMQGTDVEHGQVLLCGAIYSVRSR